MPMNDKIERNDKDTKRPPVRVLMVCLGNICRSPTAEAIFRHRVEQRGLSGYIEVDSAGTSDWHVGDPPDTRSIDAARRRNYDLGPLRARQATAADFHHFDYILAMDHANRRDLLAICPPGQENRLTLFLSHGSSVTEEVPDPYHDGQEGFENVLDLIEDACDHLIDRILEERPPA